MKTDDLILVSIDDHVVEPLDMFLRHVPAKYMDEAPIVVTDEKGVDQWMYRGRPQGSAGSRRRSWPAEEWAVTGGIAESAAERLRRPRARPRHEPRRDPGVDVLRPSPDSRPGTSTRTARRSRW